MSFDFNLGRPASSQSAPETPLPGAFSGVDSVTTTWDWFIPEALRNDPESHRRARLQVRFGILGAIFGAVYAAFYFLISHEVGAWIILACSFAVATVPFLLKAFGRLGFTGHFYAAVLLTGFTALSLVEGGMRGHAVAWLASIPLCVLLLVELRGALVWTGICTLVVAALGVSHLAGVHFPKTYAPEWEAAIDLAGYAGLIPFMALLGLIFEVTRRRAFDRLKAALGELSEANQRLVRLNEEKNEFLNIAAHDLKNPLGVISGYAGLLQMFDDHDAESVKEQAGEILGSANRMLDIIRNLLDTRAIEDGRLNLRPESCPLGPVVARLLRDYGNASKNKNIDLRVEEEAADLAVIADSGALHQILDNLLSNAIKYSPRGRPVSLSLSRDRNGNVSIAILDRGPGLSAEDQGKLFGKFVRLTPQPTAGESSNGLGLWIVQRMARLMGGDVTCQSQLGEGSTFTLTLPAAAGREAVTSHEGLIALAS